MNGWMKNKLKIVLDTNVLLVSISDRSEYHWIFQKIINGDFILCVTNEILTEYAEVISRKMDSYTAKETITSLLLLENVLETTIYFKWNLISADEDDNKFVDCAVASNADYILTHDKYFNILKQVEFPKINLLTIPDFQRLIQN